MSENGNDKRLSLWPGREPDKAGQRKDGGGYRKKKRARKRGRFFFVSVRSQVAPAASLLEACAEDRHEKAPAFPSKKDAQKKTRFVALAASDSAKHGCANLGGLPDIQGSGAFERMV